MAKRIIKAMRNNIVIGDMGNRSINLRTIGDTIDLLAPVIQGRGRKSRFSLEEICESKELDRLIADGSVELYDENNALIDSDGTKLMTGSDVINRYASAIYFSSDVTQSASPLDYTLEGGKLSKNGDKIEVSFTMKGLPDESLDPYYVLRLNGYDMFSTANYPSVYKTYKIHITRTSQTELFIESFIPVKVAVLNEAFEEADAIMYASSFSSVVIDWESDSSLILLNSGGVYETKIVSLFFIPIF